MDILESCYFRIIPNIHYYQNTTSAFERCRFKVHPNKKKIVGYSFSGDHANCR